MRSSVIGVTKVTKGTAFPKFVSGIFGLQNKEMLSTVRVGRNLEDTPKYFILDLNDEKKESVLYFDTTKVL